MKVLVEGYFNDYYRKKVEFWLVWVPIPDDIEREEDFTIQDAKQIALEKVAEETGSPLDAITISDFRYIGPNPRIIR